MNYFLGYLFAILAIISIITNIYLNILYWRRDYGSSPVPLLTAILGTLAVMFFKEWRISSGGFILLIFFVIFTLDIFLGAYAALIICHLFHISKETDWEESWDIKISFITDEYESEFPKGVTINILNKGKKEIEGGNFTFHFYEEDKLYCFSLIPDFNFPFKNKLKLSPGENISHKAFFKDMRFVGANGVKIDFLEIKKHLEKTNWKVIASINDHYASRREIKSNPLIFNIS